MQNKLGVDLFDGEPLSLSSCDINNSRNGSPLPHRTKKHVHFGRFRRKISVGTELAHSNNSQSGLSDILDWLRPRAFSDQARQQRRKSVDCNLLSVSRASGSSRSSNSSKEPFIHSSEDINRPLFVDAKMASSWVNSIPQEYLYQRATLSADHLASKNSCRPRSNSEVGRYLILRRSRDAAGKNDIIGRLEDSGEQAYCQLLSNMKCADLMPQFTKMIAFESALPIRKAFVALVNNSVRAAVIIDQKTSKVIGLITVTDLINILLELTTKKSDDLLNQPLSKALGYDKPHKKALPLVLNIDDSLYQATKLLCQRSIHRIIILDSINNGNPLFLLSKKMILKALQKYISLLPLASCMHAQLDDLRIGTWNDHVITVKMKTTIYKCVLKFLGKNISSLPVVDTNNCVVDILTKVDLMNIVTDEGPTEMILQKTVQDTVSTKHAGVEKMVTCHKKSTLLTAVESLLQSNAHRLIVVNSGGHLEAIIAVADLMRFLVGNV